MTSRCTWSGVSLASKQQPQKLALNTFLCTRHGKGESHTGYLGSKKAGGPNFSHPHPPTPETPFQGWGRIKEGGPQNIPPPPPPLSPLKMPSGQNGRGAGGGGVGACIRESLNGGLANGGLRSMSTIVHDYLRSLSFCDESSP